LITDPITSHVHSIVGALRMPSSDEIKGFSEAKKSHGSVPSNTKPGFDAAVDIADLAHDFGCRIFHVKMVISAMYLRTLSTFALTAYAFHLSQNEVPPAWGLSIVSAAVGSFISGILADNIGRRYVLQLGVYMQLLFSLAMLLFGAQTGLSINAILLVLLGLSTGALMVLPMPIMVELFPPKLAFLASAVVELGQVLGCTLAVFWTPPCGGVGDRWLPALITLLSAGGTCVTWCIPESPRWLLVRRRVADCRSILKRLFESQNLCGVSADTRYTSCPSGVKVAPRSADVGGHLAKAADDKLRRALFYCACLSISVGVATAVSQLPQIPSAHCKWGMETGYQRLGALPLPSGLESTTTGLAFLAVFIATFAGNLNRKGIMAAGLFCATACTILIGLLQKQNSNFAAVCCVAVTAIHILRVVFMVYIMEQFPTSNRATAAGISGLATLMGPVILTHITLCFYRWGGNHPSAAVAVPALALVCGLATLPFMEETKHQTLHDV